MFWALICWSLYCNPPIWALARPVELSYEDYTIVAFAKGLKEPNLDFIRNKSLIF